MSNSHNFKYSDAAGPYYHTLTEITYPQWIWEEYRLQCEKEGNEPDEVLPVLMRLYLDGKIRIVEDDEITKLRINIADRYGMLLSARKREEPDDNVFDWCTRTVYLPNVLSADFQSYTWKCGRIPDHVINIIIKRYAEKDIDRIPQSFVSEYWNLNQGGGRDGKEWWFYLDEAARALGIGYEFPPPNKHTSKLSENMTVETEKIDTEGDEFN